MAKKETKKVEEKKGWRIMSDEEKEAWLHEKTDHEKNIVKPLSSGRD